MDAYFVGGLGTGPMGAISVTYPLEQIMMRLRLLFGNDAASYIARLLGQKRTADANRVASTALYGGLVIGVVLIAGTLLLLPPILQLMGAAIASRQSGCFCRLCAF